MISCRFRSRHTWIMCLMSELFWRMPRPKTLPWSAWRSWRRTCRMWVHRTIDFFTNADSPVSFLHCHYILMSCMSLRMLMAQRIGRLFEALSHLLVITYCPFRLGSLWSHTCCHRRKNHHIWKQTHTHTQTHTLLFITLNFSQLILTSILNAAHQCPTGSPCDILSLMLS